MQILLTGGAGFIGSHVLERLLAAEHRVTVLDDFNTYYDPQFKRRNIEPSRKNPAMRLIEGDVSNLDLVREVIGSTRPDMIIHLAARAGVRASVKDPFIYQRVNVEGTLNVLESARMANVKKITFASTSSVYGLNAKVPFSETDPIFHTISPYAATKLAGEALCRAYHHLHKMDIVALRFFSVYGPRGRPDMAIYQFTERISKGFPITVFGDGAAERDYTYIDDIVQGVMATTRRPFGFEVINLGEAQTIPLSELIALIEKAVGKKANVDRQPEQPGDVPRTFADIRKAQRLLDYQPRTKIWEGIPKFVSWFKSLRP